MQKATAWRLRYLCPDCRAPLGGETCGECGWRLTFADHIPVLFSTRDAASPLQQGYIANYQRIARDDIKASMMDPAFCTELASKTAELLGPLDNLSVCDVGAGKCYLVRQLIDRRAAKITAVDVVPDYLAKFCQGDNVAPVVANAENLPFEDEFDLITCTDVVEHVLNISALFYSLNKALKPGGRLAIRIPYREDLLKYAPQTGYPYDLVHLRTFDRPSLRDLLAEAGFRVSQSYFDGFNFSIRRGM